MALSFCSSWGAYHPLDIEMAAYQQPQQADHMTTTGLLCFCDSCAAAAAASNNKALIDPFIEPNDFYYLENNTHLLPYLNVPEPINSLPLDLYKVEEWECYQYPKRARNCGEFYSPDFVYGYSDGSAAVVACPAPDLTFSPAELQLPMAGFSPGTVVVDSSKKSNGGCLSAQSMAARHRRKRITDKTQELGKLIPGGNKMNTAEMFQAAFNYVKYLQAQVGILQLMGSVQLKNEEGGQPGQVEQLQVIASPKVQEKLYIEEKCIVPSELVATLGKDPELKSNPSIYKDLDRLIKTLG